MAFLLARSVALNVWVYALFLVINILEELFEITFTQTARARHYYEGMVVLICVRVLLHIVAGAFLWLQAPRVGRWMEGRPSVQPREDAPPLPHP